MTIIYDSSIVIVGAGSIGLATAYQLALRSRHLRITVVDAFEKPFGAASSTCTGCFHYRFADRGLVPMGKYSFDLWATESQQPAFRAVTGYHAQSSFGIGWGTGQKLDVLPDWVARNVAWDVDTAVLGQETATVNPIGIGNWLTRQCLALGVHIVTGRQVVGVTLTAQNAVQSVTCRTQDGAHSSHSSHSSRIGCRKLLLACGPWTPAVYAALFPASSVQLCGTTDAGDWIRFASPCPTALDSVAFVSFAAIKGDKLEFAGRGDGTIWACGSRNNKAALPPPGCLNAPDEDVVQSLRDSACKWINWGCACAETHSGDDAFQLVAQGRAFRPATTSGRPVISAVPASRLTDKNNRTAGAGAPPGCRSHDIVAAAPAPSGVFLCWGHGSYGLTLGLGSGRLVSQLMLGEETDLDLAPFSLGADCDSAQVEAKM